VQVSDLLANGYKELRLGDITPILPFALDNFQAQAVELLLNRSSVVVSAPTGAGKTIIAECATVAALARCASVINPTSKLALYYMDIWCF
jgi:superfamily II RNA helicase